VEPEYHSPSPPNTSFAPPRYRGVSYVKPITAAKEAVSVFDLADRLCGAGELRSVGQHWTARCPLPNHEDKVPSFVVYPETNSFFCFGCLRGGDVVDLARFAWGYDERDAHTAAAMLLLEFGQEVPELPPSWFRKQERQRRTRESVEQTRKGVLRRRLFKYLILPLIDGIDDEEERGRELDRAWSDFRRFMP
jgi:CHC2 zinc finger